MNIRRIWLLLKITFSQWRQDQASLMAAALAYYTVFSLAPLLIIVIAIAGAVFGEQAAKGELVMQMQGLIGKEGAQLIQTAIENASQLDPSQGPIPTLINIVLLLSGASVIFGQLQQSLNRIWNVEPKPGNGIIDFLRKRLLSFSIVLVIGFLLLVSLVISTILVILGNYLRDLVPGFTYLWQLLNFLVSFGIVTLLFALIFKILPDAKIAWKDVWMGAALTALLFDIGKFLLGFYLGKTSLASAYGAAGSLVIILTWVFYSAQILFLGAEFTQVYVRSGGKEIAPAEYAMHVPKTACEKVD
ncbi:YihY/virulence factor BrkB family protein [Allocoleopsis franciscana]|uniref:Putative membrane protein n=1 Tax=Allocoleopsis franciscana PCC 7113 TaxID=1173027 RepID=K9WFZ9_9CYAN|nr:YihY/virulence factor BrkB family protein [Allocoleopsis franciscana]AFZ18694.1 putative membrane protein [Allocoleopsis franciscana PCC 7113]